MKFDLNEKYYGRDAKVSLWQGHDDECFFQVHAPNMKKMTNGAVEPGITHQLMETNKRSKGNQNSLFITVRLDINSNFLSPNRTLYFKNATHKSGRKNSRNEFFDVAKRILAERAKRILEKSRRRRLTGAHSIRPVVDQDEWTERRRLAGCGLSCDDDAPPCIWILLPILLILMLAYFIFTKPSYHKIRSERLKLLRETERASRC